MQHEQVLQQLTRHPFKHVLACVASDPIHKVVIVACTATQQALD